MKKFIIVLSFFSFMHIGQLNGMQNLYTSLGGIAKSLTMSHVVTGLAAYYIGHTLLLPNMYDKIKKRDLVDAAALAAGAFIFRSKITSENIKNCAIIMIGLNHLMSGSTRVLCSDIPGLRRLLYAADDEIYQQGILHRIGRLFSSFFKKKQTI